VSTTTLAYAPVSDLAAYRGQSWTTLTPKLAVTAAFNAQSLSVAFTTSAHPDTAAASPHISRGDFEIGPLPADNSSVTKHMDHPQE